jgi:dipeptidyl aminopeptidase/acylaminoacyl peptidase
VRYPARDGRHIPALLTLPPEASGRPLPAVVLPPDDPWLPRPWRYDPLVQLLANRGYAVLQPLPRGATGWGRGHLEAGRGQWGSTMLDDLADGVGWLIAEGIAPGDRVAIAGSGWGGYAAVASLAFTPDLYAAGVSLGGPIDLLGLVQGVPPSDPRRRALLRRLVGDPDDPAQRERLRRQSPLADAGSIRAPLLRVERHGDPWGGAAAGERLVAVLEELGRPVDHVTVAGGSGPLAGAEGAAVAAVVESFLAGHLGGRAQGSAPPRVAAVPP